MSRVSKKAFIMSHRYVKKKVFWELFFLVVNINFLICLIYEPDYLNTQTNQNPIQKETNQVFRERALPKKNGMIFILISTLNI